MNELHKILRDNTQDIHNKLEKESLLVAYMSQDLTQSGLFNILIQTYTAYLQWQLQLDNSFFKFKVDKRFHIDLHYRHLLPDDKSVDIDTKNLQIPHLKINKIEHYLGCAYVFEGSKLGAKIIYNSLLNNKNLSLNSIQYFNFLANENTSFCS